MKKQGIDVIGFGAGEPDFDTPSNISKSGIRAIEMGLTKYTAAAGMPELRSAIAEKLSRENGLSYSPSQIVVSCGAKHAIFNILQAICDEGDEVIILSPYWVSYSEAVKLSGGTPVFVSAGMDTGFKVTLDEIVQAVTDRTKALIINSPCNPTGAVYTPAEIEAIGRALLDMDLYIISDEIYERLVYDGTVPTSIAGAVPGLKDRAFIVNGVSKTYAMTGWRIGYAAGPEEEISAVVSIQSHSASAPAHFAQVAATEAITGDQSSVRLMVEEFRRRRDYMVSRLNSMEGVECSTPAGAFYVFPKVSSLYGRTLGGGVIEDSADFCARMLETARIALVPGSAFGADECVRLSYAMSMDSIERGLDRMEEAIAQMT